MSFKEDLEGITSVNRDIGYSECLRAIHKWLNAQIGTLDDMALRALLGELLRLNKARNEDYIERNKS